MVVVFGFSRAATTSEGFCRDDHFFSRAVCRLVSSLFFGIFVISACISQSVLVWREAKRRCDCALILCLRSNTHRAGFQKKSVQKGSIVLVLADSLLFRTALAWSSAATSFV